MATAQRTRPRAVVGAPRRAVWQLKSASGYSVSAAPRTTFFSVNAGELFLYVHCTTKVSDDVTII